MTNKKYIDIKEFREKGYLFELNRQFLHPLGLALEIKVYEDGSEYLSGIWDYRDDPEGVLYSDEIMQSKSALVKSEFVKNERASKAINRKDKCNEGIQFIISTQVEEDEINEEEIVRFLESKKFTFQDGIYSNHVWYNPWDTKQEDCFSMQTRPDWGVIKATLSKDEDYFEEDFYYDSYEGINIEQAYEKCIAWFKSKTD